MRLPSRGIVLALILGAAAVLKIAIAFSPFADHRNDGSYYMEIATHVRDGEGLSTRLSLFHHGYRTFPHPSPVYPLWPLLLGNAARVMPMEVAARALPPILWVVAVAACWRWAAGLGRVPVFRAWPRGPDSADAAMVLMALNPAFFLATSAPLTEALAYALLFLLLIRAGTLSRAGGVTAGVELGMVAGLIFLTRSQLVLVAIALAAALALRVAQASKDRWNALSTVLSFGGALAALLLPHYARLAATSVRPLEGMLRFEMAQANTLLPPVHVLVDSNGTMATLIDRIAGVGIAFSPFHELAYMRLFFGLQYALPFLAIVACVARKRLALEWLRSRADLAFLVLFAAGGVLSIHLVHKDFGAEWHFARRHALTAFFAFYLSWSVLIRSQGLLRGVAVLLVVGSVIGGGSQVVRHSAKLLSGSAANPDPSILRTIVDDHRDGNGSVTLASASFETQRFMLRFGSRVNIHWLHPGTSIEDLETLVRELGVRLLIVRHDRREREWLFLADRERFDSRFELIADADRHFVFIPREIDPRVELR